MEILESQKLSVSIFLGPKGLNKIKKKKKRKKEKKNYSKPPNLGSQSLFTFQVISTKANFFYYYFSLKI